MSKGCDITAFRNAANFVRRAENILNSKETTILLESKKSLSEYDSLAALRAVIAGQSANITYQNALAAQRDLAESCGCESYETVFGDLACNCSELSTDLSPKDSDREYTVCIPEIKHF